MKKILSVMLCLATLHINAGSLFKIHQKDKVSDYESEDTSGPITARHFEKKNQQNFQAMVAASEALHQANDPIAITMDNLEDELPQDSLSNTVPPSSFLTNIAIAQFVTRANQHSQATRAMHLSSPTSNLLSSEKMQEILYNYLHKIEKENPQLHADHMATIAGHHDNYTRAINITRTRGTTIADPTEIDPNITAALSTANPTVTDLLNCALQANHQEQTAEIATVREQKWRFGVGLVVTTLVALGGIFAAVGPTVVAIIQAT